MNKIKPSISYSELFGAVVKTLPKLYSILVGLYYAKFTSKTSNLGLAWIFNRAVKMNPDGKAILYQNRSYTYNELDEWSNKIGNFFLSKNLKKGDVIAVFMKNRPEYLATILGGAKIGLGMALINSDQKGKVLLHSLKLLNPKLIIVGSELIDPFQEVRQEIDIDKEYLYLMSEEEVEINAQLYEMKDMKAVIIQSTSGSLHAHWKNIIFDTPLFFIYTSGTTGLPKASKFNNGRYTKAFGLFGYVTMRYSKKDIVYVPLPLYHATGLAVAWGSILQGGATIAVEEKFSASKFWSRINHFNATSFAYVGELCNYLIAQPITEEERINKVTSVIGNGMRLGNWSKFKKRFGIEKIGEFYASSEGNVGFSNFLNLDYTCGFGGVPFAIVEFDREKDEPVKDESGMMIKVPKGEVGLLIGEISAASPFDGYTQKDKTEKVIMRDCLVKGDSYFNTGDLVRNQGFKHVQFVDRTGDTFRWKGHNVSTTEIENLILDFNGIDEVVVYGIFVPKCNGKAGMANIILQENSKQQIDFVALIKHLEKNTAGYSIPVFLRVSKSVDTTGTFKHSKVKLREEAFYLDKVGQDKVYVRLSKSDTYTLLTPELLNQIEKGEVTL